MEFGKWHQLFLHLAVYVRQCQHCQNIVLRLKKVSHNQIYIYNKQRLFLDVMYNNVFTYVGHIYYILQHDFLFAIGDFCPNLIVFLSILFPTWWYIWVAKSSNRLCTFSDVRADVSLKLKPFSFAYSELSAWRTNKKYI